MYKYIIRLIITAIIIVLLVTSKKTIISKIDINKIDIDTTSLIINNKGYISIKKINLKQILLDINDPNNNIENNVTIKDIDETKKYFLIMAHSGSGPKAYFKNLKYLNIGDVINISYNNISYNYHITNIERQEKNGNIYIKKSNNTLVLTTCDINNKQLIIYAKI